MTGRGFLSLRAQQSIMLTASAIASAAKQSELRAVSVLANPFLICHCERSEAI